LPLDFRFGCLTRTESEGGRQTWASYIWTCISLYFRPILVVPSLQITNSLNSELYYRIYNDRALRTRYTQATRIGRRPVSVRPVSVVLFAGKYESIATRRFNRVCFVASVSPRTSELTSESETGCPLSNFFPRSGERRSPVTRKRSIADSVNHGQWT